MLKMPEKLFLFSFAAKLLKKERLTHVPTSFGVYRRFSEI